MDITAFFLTILAIALIALIVFLVIGSAYLLRVMLGEIAATRRLRKMARDYADATFCATPTVVDFGARGERLEDDLK